MRTLKSVDQRKSITNHHQKKSQRREPRHGVKPGLYVVFKKSPRFRFGRSQVLHTATLLDVSLEGLRARYKATDMWSSPFDHISIITADNTVIVNDIYCKIISDFQEAYIYEGDRARVCGVKFSKLNNSQKHKLENFIRERTVDEENSARWNVQFD
ncbi:MAG: hypothetical protein JRF32_07570 [Deltaproteobacteria bacterium]|nr:hypothetical protein [Deltaproteobacteria bacterium]MBW2176575.1 hypothetical protein [Deltaproteobacteria bacterium]MBW2297448.1 hypothetical protein [Deltaproteobacteria bacterium]